MQEIGVITDNASIDKDNSKVENQILNCYPVMHTQSQEQPFKAKNLSYIQVMIHDQPTHLVIDTRASRSIFLGQHADDIKIFKWVCYSLSLDNAFREKNSSINKNSI